MGHHGFLQGQLNFKRKMCQIKYWRKLRNEELHNLYCTPIIIKVNKTWRMASTGQAATRGGGGMRNTRVYKILS
jgi:hypothetical protein